MKTPRVIELDGSGVMDMADLYRQLNAAYPDYPLEIHNLDVVNEVAYFLHDDHPDAVLRIGDSVGLSVRLGYELTARWRQGQLEHGLAHGFNDDDIAERQERLRDAKDELGPTLFEIFLECFRDAGVTVELDEADVVPPVA